MRIFSSRWYTLTILEPFEVQPIASDNLCRNVWWFLIWLLNDSKKLFVLGILGASPSNHWWFLLTQKSIKYLMNSRSLFYHFLENSKTPLWKTFSSNASWKNAIRRGWQLCTIFFLNGYVKYGTRISQWSHRTEIQSELNLKLLRLSETIYAVFISAMETFKIAEKNSLKQNV